jgi:hypothetical protein
MTDRNRQHDDDQLGFFRASQATSLRLFQAGALGVTGLIAWVIYKSPVQDLTLLSAGALMILLATFPALRWARRGDDHFPIFEVFLLTFVPFYGISMLAGHPEMLGFGEESTGAGALAVLIFQGGMLAAFYGISPPAVRTPLMIMPLLPETFLRYAQTGLWLNTAFIYINGFTDWIPNDLRLPLRATFFGLGTIALYVEMRRWGAGRLGAGEKFAVSLALSAQCILLVRELYLIVSLSLLLVAALAYVSSSRRIPWLPFVFLLPALGLLHSGKAAMRTVYWEGGQALPSLEDLPGFFYQWAEAGLDSRDSSELPGSTSLTGRLFERASLFHMLCFVIDRTPEKEPFLAGESYIYIPSQLIPSFLWPGKPSSLKSNVLLAIHYKLVPDDGSARVSIAFGMVSESFANFGYWGCAIMGAILGLFYSMVTAAATGAPQFSAVGLLSILLGAWSFQSEQIFATWFISLLQATAVVIAIPLALRIIFPATFRRPAPPEEP